MKNINLTLVMLLSTISVLVAVTSLTMSVYAQEEINTTDSNELKFFAIQHVNYGSVSEINATAYTLELNKVSNKTILFSDRPDRIVMSISTTDFIGNWTTGQDSYSVDATNAVLVVEEKEEQDNSIVELFNPIYDKEKRILKYDIIPDYATSISLPKEFGELLY